MTSNTLKKWTLAISSIYVVYVNRFLIATSKLMTTTKKNLLIINKRVTWQHFEAFKQTAIIRSAQYQHHNWHKSGSTFPQNPRITFHFKNLIYIIKFIDYYKTIGKNVFVNCKN